MGIDRVANFLARYAWFLALWTMRRPVIKRLRTGSWQMWRSPRREQMRDRIFAQDRFARRYGLVTLRVVFTVVISFMVVVLMAWIGFQLIDSGFLSVPDSIRPPTEAG